MTKPTTLEIDRASRKRRFLKAIADGRCTSCLRRPATEGRRTCKPCRRKSKRWQRAYRVSAIDTSKKLRSDRKAQGLCSRCGKRAPAEGLIQCRRCLNNCRRAHLKARQQPRWLRIWKALKRVWRA